MSRELKFKVWSKEKHTFLHTREEFNPNKGLEFLWYDGVREGWRGIGYFIEKPESFEVVQYTGLKDTKGVEIYERDLIKLSEAPYVYKVYWYEYRLGIFCNNPALTKMGWAEQPFNKSVYKRCEVVGNVFETPELFK